MGDDYESGAVPGDGVIPLASMIPAIVGSGLRGRRLADAVHHINQIADDPDHDADRAERGDLRPSARRDRDS